MSEENCKHFNDWPDDEGWYCLDCGRLEPYDDPNLPPRTDQLTIDQQAFAEGTRREGAF